MTRLSRSVHRSAAKTYLWRVGESITIRTPDAGGSANIFGKEGDTDKTFTEVPVDEHAYRFTSREDEHLGGTRHEGGLAESQLPRIMLAHDTVVDAGDIIDFPDGLSYHVPSTLEDHGAYKMANATLYTDE